MDTINEPVAWMYRIKDTDNKWELTWIKPTTKELFDSEPLYTHPAKELTDEEIEECACFLDVVLHHRYELKAVVKDIDWTITGYKEFARAILRKAQEK